MLNDISSTVYCSGILVPVRTYSFGLRLRGGKTYSLQCKVDVADMLNAIKSVLADVSGVSPLSEQKANNYVTFSETVTRRRNDLKL